MKTNLIKPIVAEVDLHRVKYSRPEELGIDFTNEIDIWSKMKFRYREQIKHLGKNRTLEGHDFLKGTNSLVYSIREKIE